MVDLDLTVVTIGNNERVDTIMTDLGEDSPEPISTTMASIQKPPHQQKHERTCEQPRHVLGYISAAHWPKCTSIAPASASSVGSTETARLGRDRMSASTSGNGTS